VRRATAVEFAAQAWHCEGGNRLYLAESLEASRGEVLKGVVGSIACHEEA
jgi:hypothetical protein